MIGSTGESLCLSPVQQTPTSLTPIALTMEGPSTHLGANGYRLASFPDRVSSDGQPRPESIYFSTVTSGLNNHAHGQTESFQWSPAPTAIAAEISSGRFAALPEGTPVQPNSLRPMGSGFVPSHFVSQPTMPDLSGFYESHISYS